MLNGTGNSGRSSGGDRENFLGVAGTSAAYACRSGVAIRMRVSRAAGGRPGRSPETYYQNVDALTWNLDLWRDAMIADAEATGGVGSNIASTATIPIADIAIRLHDLAGAKICCKH